MSRDEPEPDDGVCRVSPYVGVLGTPVWYSDERDALSEHVGGLRF